MLELFSPAKINLTLKVIGKESSGYHQIETLMQAVSLGDSIRLSFRGSENLTCSSPNLLMDEGNLAVKALRLFQKKTGMRTPVSIHLEKNIPIEAGLGGGSGNAATVLWGMNVLAETNLPDSVLSEWASEIGSDIPFFFSHGTAHCRGRGEIVQPKPPCFSEECVIVKPPYGLSTKAVYQSFSKGSEQANTSYYNDLEKAAFSLSPELKSFRDTLAAQGFKQVLLCGSGSALACFGEGRIQLPEASIFTNIRGIQRKQGYWYPDENL